MRVKTIFLLKEIAALAFLLPPACFAHAEVLKAADEDNFVSFYGVPLSPLQGEKVSWLTGFVENFSLTNRSLQAKYSIVEASSGKVLAQTGFAQVKGGASSFEHAFAEPGIFELRVDYYYEEAPQKVFSVDLQAQVREKPLAQGAGNGFAAEILLGVFIIGVVLGVVATLFWASRKR